MNDADIRIDVMPPQHSGGQHTPSMCRGVRATYLPTGQYAECDSEISERRNRLVALAALRLIVPHEGDEL
jgi:protein subunit release factor A